MKDASDFDPVVGVGIVSILGGYQQPIRLVTVLVQVRRVVMPISQKRTGLRRELRATERTQAHYQRHWRESAQRQWETRRPPRPRPRATSSHRPSHATHDYVTSGLPFQFELWGTSPLCRDVFDAHTPPLARRMDAIDGHGTSTNEAGLDQADQVAA